MTNADLWTGGRVFTGRRYAEALLVEDGRVVGVGAEEEVRRLAPTGAERRSLEGRLVVPGLIDAHVHLAEIARMRAGPPIAGSTSLEQLLAIVAAWAAAHPTGAVVGRGWDPERWPDHRWPEAAALDRVARDRPVILYHASGHAAVVNSVALGEIGLDPGLPARSDPQVGRGTDGRPNGLLYEEAMHPLWPLAGATSRLDRTGLGEVVAELASRGITSVGAIGSSTEELDRLSDLDAAGALPVTVRAYVRLSERVAGQRRVAGPDGTAGVAVVGVKAFLDGAFGPRTAWLSEPYTDAPRGNGLALGDGAELAEALREAVDGGLAPALHAIGDRALARGLELLDALRGDTRAPRRIEHAALTPPGLLPLLDRVRPTLVVQPGFVWSDHWLEQRLGAERARWAYAFRTLRSRGIPLAGSSDAPYDPSDPWRGLRAAVVRRDPQGRSANPDPTEALSAEEALGLYTTGAAAALGLGTRGHLEVGAVADFAVLSVRDLSVALDGRERPVEATWQAGRKLSATA